MKNEAEYEFEDFITPYFTTPPEKTGSTLTYFNQDTYCLEIWNIDDVSLRDHEMEIKNGAPIVSIPYADLWRGLSWSKWKPESEK